MSTGTTLTLSFRRRDDGTSVVLVRCDEENGTELCFYFTEKGSRIADWSRLLDLDVPSARGPLSNRHLPLLVTIGAFRAAQPDPQKLARWFVVDLLEVFATWKAIGSGIADCVKRMLPGYELVSRDGTNSSMPSLSGGRRSFVQCCRGRGGKGNDHGPMRVRLRTGITTVFAPTLPASSDPLESACAWLRQCAPWVELASTSPPVSVNTDTPSFALSLTKSHVQPSCLTVDEVAEGPACDGDGGPGPPPQWLTTEQRRACLSIGNLQTYWVPIEGNGLDVYEPSGMATSLEPGELDLRPEYRDLYQRICEEQQALGGDGMHNGDRLSLVRYRRRRSADGQRLESLLTFRRTKYFRFLASGVDTRGTSLRTEDLRRWNPADQPLADFPNSFGISLILLSTEEKGREISGRSHLEQRMWFVQRSNAVGPRPKEWDVTVVEGTRPADTKNFTAPPEILPFAERALRWEAGIGKADIEILGFGVDLAYYQWNAFGLVRVHASEEEVHRWLRIRARDSYERSRVESVEADPKCVFNFIGTRRIWSSGCATAYYALVRLFGFDAVDAAAAGVFLTKSSRNLPSELSRHRDEWWKYCEEYDTEKRPKGFEEPSELGRGMAIHRKNVGILWSGLANLEESVEVIEFAGRLLAENRLEDMNGPTWQELYLLSSGRYVVYEKRHFRGDYVSASLCGGGVTEDDLPLEARDVCDHFSGLAKKAGLAIVRRIE